MLSNAEGSKEQIWQTLAETRRFVGEWTLTNKKAPCATMARGVRRQHKAGACQSHNVLSMDLSGPFPPCLGNGYCYGLMAVYPMGV